MELADREYGEKHDAATYGPFSSEEAVHRYLDRVPNPGGYSLDDSGKSPAPTRSPDGSPVVRP